MHFHIAVAFVIGWKMEKNGVHYRSPNRDSSFISGCQEESGRSDFSSISFRSNCIFFLCINLKSFAFMFYLMAF